MDIIIYVVIAVIALIVGVVATLIAQKNMSQSRAKIIIEEANSEAEVIKKNKLLEAREEEIRIIAEAEKQASQRMSKAQSFEGKLKQRELQLNQQQSENQRSRNEIEQTRAKLDDQLALAESKQTELDALKRKAQEELERVSGLSSDEASGARPPRAHFRPFIRRSKGETHGKPQGRGQDCRSLIYQRHHGRSQAHRQ